MPYSYLFCVCDSEYIHKWFSYTLKWSQALFRCGSTLTMAVPYSNLPGFKLWKGCNMTRSKYNIGHIAPSVTQFERVICMGNTHGNNLIWTQRICVVTYNIPALVQIMAWHICVSLRTHTCVTRPQWIMRTHIGLLAHICIGEIDQNSMRWRFQFSVKSKSTPMLPHDH